MSGRLALLSVILGHTEQYLYVGVRTQGNNCGTEIDRVPTTGYLIATKISQMRVNMKAIFTGCGVESLIVNDQQDLVSRLLEGGGRGEVQQ